VRVLGLEGVSGDVGGGAPSSEVMAEVVSSCGSAGVVLSDWSILDESPLCVFRSKYLEIFACD
jgi:hypothetical protein